MRKRSNKSKDQKITTKEKKTFVNTALGKLKSMSICKENVYK